MATTRLILLHTGKGCNGAETLGRSTDHIENPDKTNGSGRDVITFSSTGFIRFYPKVCAGCY